MSTHIDALAMRRSLGRDDWAVPSRFGPDGWVFKTVETADPATIIVTADTYRTGRLWVHASISRPVRMPSYWDLKMLHHAVFGRGYAFQVFVPPSEHVDIHPNCLHLFGLKTGERPGGIPDFALNGKSI